MDFHPASENVLLLEGEPDKSGTNPPERRILNHMRHHEIALTHDHNRPAPREDTTAPPHEKHNRPAPEKPTDAGQRLDAQVMQRRAAGIASRRASPIGLPHSSQSP